MIPEGVGERARTIDGFAPLKSSASRLRRSLPYIDGFAPLKSSASRLRRSLPYI
jgi:hypothetical protein